MLQRRDDPAFWQSVTGSLEEHEMPHDAAVREVWEEERLKPPQRTPTFWIAKKT